MASVGTVVIEVDANIAKLVDGMQKSQNQISMLQRKATEMQSTFAKFAKIAASFYIIKEAIEGAIGVTSKFVNTKAQFEQYETVLRTLEGSSIKAKQSMKWIQDFAAKTPYEIGEVTNAFVKMKSYGMNPTNGSLKTLGDTAAAMGKNISDAVEMMADAVTGENERLKEFGVKAAVMGDKIKYTWADASGQTKSIIVANNREIIESTLEAIFNSKYAGAMDAQSATWNGIMSNLADKWTNFQIAVMDSGLFDYIKAVALTISDYLSVAFANGAEGAKTFSIYAVEGIKSVVIAVGNMYDMWNGIQLVWSALKTTFLGLVAGIIGGINYIAKAWDWAVVSIQNGAKWMIEFIGNGWNKLINFLIDGLNKFISSGLMSGIGSAFELIGLKNPFKTINFHLGKFDSGIKAAKVSTKDFIDNGITKLYQESLSHEKSLWNAVANEDGKKKAEKFIGDIEKNIKKLNSLSPQDKQSYKKYLEDLQKKSEAVGNAAQKLGGKGKKGHNDAAHAAKEHAKALEDAAKAMEDFAQKQQSALRDYYEMTDKRDKLFEIDSAAKLNALSEYLTGAQLAEYYDAMKKKYTESLKDSNKEVASDLASRLEKAVKDGNIVAVFAKQMYDSLSGIADSLRSGDMASVGNSVGNAIVSAFNMVLPGLGTAFDMLGALLSDVVSQAEIDRAKGRSDYNDKSIQNSLAVLENTAYPMLDATQDMRKYLRSMEHNFGSVAKAIASKAASAGIDLTGANYVPVNKVGFLGFSSKSISLIGTGLQFQVETFENMMSNLGDIVKGYTSSLVQKSSWFGLVKKSYISTKYQDLPESVLNDISNAFADGYMAILTAGVTLGFNKNNLSSIIDTAIIDLGKIDFTGLSPAEVSDRLSSALGEALNGVVNTVQDFSKLIDRYSTSAESSLETLIRIATEYEQASHMFNLIGKSFNNILNYNETMQILDIVDGIGGLTNFQDAMSSFMDNFYNDTEKLEMMNKSLTSAFATLNISMPRTKSEFRSLLETMDTSTEAGAYLYSQILQLADSFNEMITATDNLKSSVNESLQSILDAYTGELSYFTMTQKAEYASRYYSIASRSNSVLNSVDIARVAAETALKTATKKEDYIPIFERYAKELEKQAKDATNTDLLNELKAMKAEIIALRRATIDASIHAA